MNLACLLTIILSCVIVGDGFIVVHNARRRVVKELHVDNGGPWGQWGPAQFCATGTYAVGYNMKIEPPGGDDTALNGIMLECETLDGKFGGDVTSSIGPFGRWESSPINCDPGTYMKMFALQVEEPGGDDTAANFAKFMCQSFDSTAQSHELSRPPGHGEWGTYGSYSEGCDPGTAICGLKTRVEQAVGSFDDDTALNDVIMYCCSD